VTVVTDLMVQPRRATAKSDILSTQFLRYDALFGVLNGSHNSVGSRDNTTEDNLYFQSDNKVVLTFKQRNRLSFKYFAKAFNNTIRIFETES
jgi:hypothetical protein